MELFDVLIFGAVFYYILRAVRHAASAQRRSRPPGSTPPADAEPLSWTERTRRALDSAVEWEEEQRRLQAEAEARKEIRALRTAEPEAAASSLSGALQTVADMLALRASGQRSLGPAPDEQPALPVRRETTSPAGRPPARLTSLGREVQAERPAEDALTVDRRAAARPPAELAGLERLTPLQRAILYGEILGAPVALGGGIDRSPD